MTAKLLEFTGITRLDIDPLKVLEHAAAAGLTDVVVIGYDAEGEEFFASSIADGGTALWLMERARLQLLRCSDK